MFAHVFKKDKELVVKANPYHDGTGAFSSENKATFVSTGSAFSKSNGKTKESWAKEKATKPKEVNKLVGKPTPLEIDVMESWSGKARNAGQKDGAGLLTAYTDGGDMLSIGNYATEVFGSEIGHEISPYAKSKMNLPKDRVDAFRDYVLRTQGNLEKMNLDTVSHRGLVLDKIPKVGDVMDQIPASSWTTDKSTANNFANYSYDAGGNEGKKVVVSTKLPVDRVLADSRVRKEPFKKTTSTGQETLTGDFKTKVKSVKTVNGVTYIEVERIPVDKTSKCEVASMNFANVFKKEEELVVKANPYHGSGGRFSSKDQANFVSTGGVFSKTNQASKDQWDSESRSTQPKDRAKGAKQIKDVLAGPDFGWNVKAKGSKVTIKEPIFSTEKKVVDRNKAQAEKDWGRGGLYSKFVNDDHGVEVNHVASRITGDGMYGRRKNGKEVPPYYLETDVDVVSTKKKKSTRKISGLGVDMGLIG